MIPHCAAERAHLQLSASVSPSIVPGQLSPSVSLEKSKGTLLCLQGGRGEKEQGVCVGTCLGQGALGLGQGSFSGLGRKTGLEGHRLSDTRELHT